MATNLKKRDELGGKAVEVLVGEKSVALRESIVLVGNMVIGAVAATWVHVTTSFKMVNAQGEVFLDLQGNLNSVFPNLLTFAFVILCWYLLTKKKMSPLVVMSILVVISFVGVLLGVFNPGLAY